MSELPVFRPLNVQVLAQTLRTFGTFRRPTVNTIPRPKSQSERPSRRPLKLHLSSLESFLTALRPILPKPDWSSKPVKGPDIQSLTRTVGGLRPHLAAARGAGTFLNPWDVAGIGRREVRNAVVLASLWDPRFCGDAAVRFLDGFIGRLRERTGDLLPTYDDLAGGYFIRTEHCPLGDVSERVDITIEGRNFLVGIEVKIDADEGFMQLERYVGSIERRAQSRKKHAVIFLAPFVPDFSCHSPGGWSDKVTTASWSDVGRSARQCAPRRQRERDFALQLISSFGRHTSKF